MIRYCKVCILPDTKPDLWFDDNGVCSACLNYRQRTAIDWNTRRESLEVLLTQYRSKKGHWDCIVPVSGGKDSTYQVIRLLEMKMNPLCVTATTCDLSDIGRKNIENIKNLGVDYVEFTANKRIRRQLNRIGLTEVGDISWPEHVSIFTIPVRAAVAYGIPLIIWGENSQNEYGGPTAASQNNILDRNWLEAFGGLLGLSVSDIAATYDIEDKYLIPYQYPSNDELKRIGVTGLFLGYYIPWDGYSNALLAQAYGLTTYEKVLEGSIVNYENLDNYQTGIHDYFKFLKFGFGRATDIASSHIRRGRMRRDDAVELVKIHDGKFPWKYLGKTLEEILEPLDMDVPEFIAICDQFTNKRLFKTDKSGRLIKDKSGNLTKINDDANIASTEVKLEKSI